MNDMEELFERMAELLDELSRLRDRVRDIESGSFPPIDNDEIDLIDGYPTPLIGDEWPSMEVPEEIGVGEIWCGSANPGLMDVLQYAPVYEWEDWEYAE